MAAKKKRTGEASAFIRSYLTQNPQATGKEVAQAWKQAGHKSSFSQSMIYQLRSKMGLSSGRKKRRKKAVSAAVAPVAVDTGSELLAIEKSLDSLIVQAETLKDSKLAEALRVARRRVGAKLV